MAAPKDSKTNSAAGFSAPGFSAACALLTTGWWLYCILSGSWENITSEFTEAPLATMGLLSVCWLLCFLGSAMQLVVFNALTAGYLVRLLAPLGLIMSRAIGRAGKAGYRRAVVAYRTETYEALREQALKEGWVFPIGSDNLREAIEKWQRHLRKAPIILAIIVWPLGAAVGLLCHFKPELLETLLGSDFSFQQHALEYGAVTAVVLGFLGMLTLKYKNHSDALAECLNAVMEIQNKLTIGWGLSQRLASATVNLDTRDEKRPADVLFVGHEGIMLEVKKCGLIQGYSLNALSPKNLAEEDKDIDLSDPAWDQASVLKESDTASREKHVPGAWFPASLRTQLLPLLSLKLQVVNGDLNVGPIPYNDDTVERFAEVTETLKGILEIWKNIGSMGPSEAILSALHSETSEAVREKTLKDCSELSDSDLKNIGTCWAKEGTGPTRVMAACMAGDPQTECELLNILVQDTTDLEVRTLALKRLIEQFPSNGFKALALASQSNNEAIIHRLALDLIVEPTKGDRAYQAAFQASFSGVTPTPRLAASLAVIMLSLKINLPQLLDWFNASLEDPIPEHLAVIKQAQHILEDDSSGNYVSYGGALTSRLDSLGEELKPLIQARQASSQGQVTLAPTEDAQGSVALVAEGEVSFADSTES